MVNRFYEIIDSHTHWGPSLSMGTEVRTEELLGQAEQSGVSQIVVFPFPSTALADEEMNEADWIGTNCMTLLHKRSAPFI